MEYWLFIIGMGWVRMSISICKNGKLCYRSGDRGYDIDCKLLYAGDLIAEPKLGFDTDGTVIVSAFVLSKDCIRLFVYRYVEACSEPYNIAVHCFTGDVKRTLLNYIDFKSAYVVLGGVI